MMSAGVTGRADCDRLSYWDSALRETGKRVELADDRNDRPTGSPAGNERCRDLGDTGLDVKAGCLELRLEKGARFLLLVADFRERPDLLGDIRVFIAFAIDAAKDVVEDGLRLGGADGDEERW